MTRARLTSALVSTILLFGCGDRGATSVDLIARVTAVTVTPSSVIIAVGQQVALTAAVLTSPPSDVPVRVRWKSSNPAVASVDANGLVAAVAGGTTTITATSLVDTLVSGSSVISVGPNSTGVISIDFIGQDGKAADLSNVSGKIDVVVNVDAGSTNVSRVDLLLARTTGDTVLASVIPSGSTPNTPTTLSFNTSGLPNGLSAIKARVVLLNGGTVVSATVQLNVKNP